jgi:hypothetical protein
MSTRRIYMRQGYRLQLPGGAVAVFNSKHTQLVTEKWLGLLPEEVYYHVDENGEPIIPVEPEDVEDMGDTMDTVEPDAGPTEEPFVEAPDDLEVGPLDPI